jgi:hypothetical protein
MDSINFDSLKEKVKKEIRRGSFIAADGKQMNGEFIMCHLKLLMELNGYGEEISAILRNDYFAMQRLNIDASKVGYSFSQRVEHILKEKICQMVDRIDVRCSNVLVNIAESYKIVMPKWLKGRYCAELGEKGWELINCK